MTGGFILFLFLLLRAKSGNDKDIKHPGIPLSALKMEMIMFFLMLKETKKPTKLHLQINKRLLFNEKVVYSSSIWV